MKLFSTTLMAFIFVTLLVLYHIVLVPWQPFPLVLFTLSAVFLGHSIIYTLPVLPLLLWRQAHPSPALEVVPLVLLGYEAFENYTRLHSAPWMHRLKWPVYCFIAVSFWNLVGAGSSAS